MHAHTVGPDVHVWAHLQMRMPEDVIPPPGRAVRGLLPDDSIGLTPAWRASAKISRTDGRDFRPEIARDLRGRPPRRSPGLEACATFDECTAMTCDSCFE